MPTHGRDLTTFAGFEVARVRRSRSRWRWFPSHEVAADAPDVAAALDVDDPVVARLGGALHGRAALGATPCVRSLLTLKALTYEPTGGIVAAATTSLPEWIGSVRNWDYRYCWLRDATFTLNALLENGYREEALVWSEWLRRAVAGSPDKLQIMYGVAGERRLDEYEIPWLAGYEGSVPVRVGNGASEQFQLDVYGEVLDMMFHTAEALEDPLPHDSWALCRMLVEHVAKVWRLPDDGIWEVRGPQRHFVHSKVMAWVAVDRWVKLCEAERPEEPLDPVAPAARRDPRRGLRQGVERRGRLVHPVLRLRRARRLAADARPRRVPAADDERIVATVEAIERELLVDGFVLRYRTEARHDRDPVADADREPAAPTTARPRSTGCRRGRARSCSPRSGSSTTWSSSVASTRPEDDLRAAAGAAQRRRPPRPRSTTRWRAACSATSPRPSPTSGWSTRRPTSSGASRALPPGAANGALDPRPRDGLAAAVPSLDRARPRPG